MDNGREEDELDFDDISISSENELKEMSFEEKEKLIKHKLQKYSRMLIEMQQIKNHPTTLPKSIAGSTLRPSSDEPSLRQQYCSILARILLINNSHKLYFID